MYSIVCLLRKIMQTARLLLCLCWVCFVRRLYKHRSRDFLFRSRRRSYISAAMCAGSASILRRSPAFRSILGHRLQKLDRPSPTKAAPDRLKHSTPPLILPPPPPSLAVDSPSPPPSLAVDSPSPPPSLAVDSSSPLARHRFFASSVITVFVQLRLLINGVIS